MRLSYIHCNLSSWLSIYKRAIEFKTFYIYRSKSFYNIASRFNNRNNNLFCEEFLQQKKSKIIEKLIDKYLWLLSIAIKKKQKIIKRLQKF